MSNLDPGPASGLLATGGAVGGGETLLPKALMGISKGDQKTYCLASLQHRPFSSSHPICAQLDPLPSTWSGLATRETVYRACMAPLGVVWASGSAPTATTCSTSRQMSTDLHPD